MYDSWQRKCKQLLHFRCKLLPVHPILRISPAQPFLPHDSCVFVGDFQHLVIAPHPIVLIMPTEFGAQASVLLAHGFVQVLFTPVPYPAEESAQPLSLGGKRSATPLWLERLVLRWIRHKHKPRRRRASLAAALHMAVIDTFNRTLSSCALFTFWQFSDAL